MSEEQRYGWEPISGDISGGDCYQSTLYAGVTREQDLEERLCWETEEVPLTRAVQTELWTAQSCSVLHHRGVGEGLGLKAADVGHQVWVVTVGVVLNGRYGGQDTKIGVLYDENIL